MKKFRLLTVALLVAGVCLSASAFDPQSLLGGGKSSSSSNPLGGLLNTVEALIGGSKVDLEKLVGNWVYSSPAVTFQSDNFLQKAGGVAAAQVVVDKLTPYYKTAGINKMKLEFGTGNTFAVSVGKLRLSGTVAEAGDGVYDFKMQALGKIPAAGIKGYINVVGGEVQITFDAKKLLALVEKVASLTGNSTLNTLGKFLGTYDGLNIGVQFKRAN